MSKKQIFDINSLEDRSTIISIPDFSGENVIYVRVKRPQILRLMQEGKIPNPLMGAAVAAVNGLNSIKEDDSLKTAVNNIEFINLYCKACLVEPSYEEFDPYMTDEQRSSIAAWALTPAYKLRRFHTKEKNNTDNTTK